MQKMPAPVSKARSSLRKEHRRTRRDHRTSRRDCCVAPLDQPRPLLMISLSRRKWTTGYWFFWPNPDGRQPQSAGSSNLRLEHDRAPCSVGVGTRACLPYCAGGSTSRHAAIGPDREAGAGTVVVCASGCCTAIRRRARTQQPVRLGRRGQPEEPLWRVG